MTLFWQITKFISWYKKNLRTISYCARPKLERVSPMKMERWIGCPFAITPSRTIPPLEPSLCIARLTAVTSRYFSNYIWWLKIIWNNSLILVSWQLTPAFMENTSRAIDKTCGDHVGLDYNIPVCWLKESPLF